MLNRIIAISRKEVKQLLRDKRMMFVLFFFPVFLLIIFGYAVNFDVQNVRLAVQDNDHTETSRDLIKTISSSSYFQIVEYYDNDKRGKEILDEGIAKGLMIIPTDFEKNIFSAKEEVKVQILLDGVDGNSAAIIQNYSIAAITSFNKKLNKNASNKIGIKLEAPINLQSRFWFNPQLQTTIYMLPGLIALILIVTAVITVSLSLVREKERGTIEQINVSSLTIFELLLGKLFPYVIISYINAAIILLAGYILFGVVVMGSYWLLFVSTFLFLFASTAIGIFISVVSDSQQVAFTIATFASLLPATILSGFIFPIESMPVIIQWLTNVTPAKFFIIALRGIIIKGVGLSAFWDQWIYMFLFATFFMLISVVKYQQSLKKL
ncbi:MAG: ABC transporter permease [Melioribacteraceae bacterium]|jgi:ABC-2 type transport system permease protein|nr:ABC transporter permease [Melioribacteraceae bacterium]